MSEKPVKPVRKRCKNNQVLEDLALYTGPIKFVEFGRSRLKLITSHIVNKEDIIKEYDERAERRRPKQLPEGGDLIFQKQITKRLAEKIIKEGTDEQPSPTKIKKMKSSDVDARFFVQIMNDSDDDGEISNNYGSTSKGESSTSYQNETFHEYDDYEQFRHFAEISEDDEPQQNMFREKLQNDFKNKLKSVMLLNMMKKKKKSKLNVTL